MISMRWLVLILLVLPLASCGFFKRSSDCDRPGGYESAVNLPPLKVPAGMDAPDTRASMPIPDISAPEKPRQPGDRCLDLPPRYNPQPDSQPPAR
jgi:uncharacterized lipoprotein